MYWLPPSYRILYTDKLNYSKTELEFILLKLIYSLEQGCLMLKYKDEFIGQVTEVNIEDNKFCFWIVERKAHYFRNNNIHINSFKININIEGKLIGTELRIENVSNILELEERDGFNTEAEKETSDAL